MMRENPQPAPNKTAPASQIKPEHGSTTVNRIVGLMLRETRPWSATQALCSRCGQKGARGGRLCLNCLTCDLAREVGDVHADLLRYNLERFRAAHHAALNAADQSSHQPEPK